MLLLPSVQSIKQCSGDLCNDFVLKPGGSQQSGDAVSKMVLNPVTNVDKKGFLYNYTLVISDSEEETVVVSSDDVGSTPRGRQYVYYVHNPDLQRSQKIIIELTGRSAPIINQEVQPLIVFDNNDYWLLFTVTIDGIYTTLEDDPEMDLINPYNDIVLSDQEVLPLSIGSYRFLYNKENITLDGFWTSKFRIHYLGKVLEFEEEWLSRSAPTKLSVENIDNTAPEVKCTFVMENEGVYQQLYNYRYWITKQPDGKYETAFNSGSDSSLLSPREKLEKTISFNVNSLGEYWCKSDIEYGGKWSVASASFIVTESDSFLPDLSYIGEKLKGIGATIYPSQPYIGLVLFFVFISIILAVVGLIPEESRNFIMKKFKKKDSLKGDEDDQE